MDLRPIASLKVSMTETAQPIVYSGENPQMAPSNPGLATSQAAALFVPWARALLARHAALFEPADSGNPSVLSGELQRWVHGEPWSPDRVARVQALDIELQMARQASLPAASGPLARRWLKLVSLLATDDLSKDLLALLLANALSPRVASALRLLSGWGDAQGVERIFTQSVLDPLETQVETTASLLRASHPLFARRVVLGLDDNGGQHLQFLELQPAVLLWLLEGPEAACADHAWLNWHAAKQTPASTWSWPSVALDVEQVLQAGAQGEARIRLHTALPEDAEMIAQAASTALGVGLAMVRAQGATRRGGGEGASLDGSAFADMLRLAGLLAVLEDGVLYLGGIAAEEVNRSLDLQPVLAALRSLPGRLWVEDAAPVDTPSLVSQISKELQLFSVQMTFPDRPMRLQIWQAAWPATTQAALGLSNLSRLSGFPLTTSQIAQTASEHEGSARAGDIERIAESCRTRIGHRVGDVAERVSSRAQWGDVVLPQPLMATVHEIIAFSRHGEQVLHQWGFAARYHYGLGLTSLFSGPPGTGKTMLAGMISRELGLDLFRVDLSRVMSKYIGETEQRLGRLFEQGQRGGVALLFDEADSLFARRTEVRSSVDRYANLEVNFLLQKMEEYSGVVFLTTNFADSIDEAFKRRIRFHVQFPMPGMDEREKLWESMVPPEMPCEDDLPFDLLAQAYEFSGGEIKNTVLRAAFYAAVEDSPLTLELLDKAAQAEAQERGRLVLRTAASLL